MRRPAAAVLALVATGAGAGPRCPALAADAGGGEPAYVKGADLELLEAVRQIARKVEELTGRRLGTVIAVRADRDALRSVAPRRAVSIGPASRLAARGRAWEDLGLGGEAAIRAVLEAIEADLPGVAIAGDPPRLLVGPDLLRGSRSAEAAEREADSAVLHATGVTPDEIVVAHALVHLLQLQAENPRAARPDTTDRILARAAWEEGEATLVALLHLFGGLGLERELLRGGLDPAEVLGGRLLPDLSRATPVPARALLDFVYREGFYRAAEVVRAEGIGALARISRLRPVTRDLLHTGRPPAGSLAPAGEPAAPAGLVLADRDEIGEQGIVTLVSSLTGKDDVALVAGDGWAGDWLSRWEPPADGSGAARAGVTEWLTLWRSPKDAEEFAYAWRRCLERRLPGARVMAAEGGSALTVEGGDRRFHWSLEGERVRLSVAPNRTRELRP